MIILTAALGGCIGSFLNVVAYRLPRGKSLIRPGSQCTWCQTPISWYDNIPVLSFFILRARCRSCRGPISPRYSLVELSTALAFVALYDVFFKSGIYGPGGFDGGHWPIAFFAMHLSLMAGLVICSVLDIEYYLIDLRIIYLIVALGLAGWLISWEPARSYPWLLASPAVFVGSLAAILAEALRRIIGLRIAGKAGGGEGSEESLPADEFPDTDSRPAAQTGLRWQFALMCVFAGLGVTLIVWAVVGSSEPSSYNPRAWCYICWLFSAILIGCTPRRESDREIVEIIEQEKSGARALALRELAALLPAGVGFAVMFYLTSLLPPLAEVARRALDLQVAGVMPFAGICAGISGLLIAVAFGWVVRIGFTLLFGKEAMGIGDIYILAAVGAIAGPMVTIIGFFVGSIIGVLGILVLLLWKTSRALSYGPWIAIGTLIVILFYGPISGYLRPATIGLVELLRGEVTVR